MIGVVVRIVVLSVVLVVISLRLRAAKLAGKQVVEDSSRPTEVRRPEHEWRPVASPPLDRVREVEPGTADGTVVGARETQIGTTTITVFDVQTEPPPAHPLACARVTMPHVSYPHFVLRRGADSEDSAFARELLDDKLRAFVDGEPALRGLVLAGSELVVVLDSAFALYDRTTGERNRSEAMTLYPADLLVPGDVEHRLAFVAGVLERIPAAVRDRYRSPDLSASM